MPSPYKTIGIYAAVLVSQGRSSMSRFFDFYSRLSGLINTFGVHLLKYLNNISVWWHAVGTVALVISILSAAPTRQSGSFVFQKFIDNTGDPGWSERASPSYVAVIGTLMAQYTLTGTYLSRPTWAIC